MIAREPRRVFPQQWREPRESRVLLCPACRALSPQREACRVCDGDGELDAARADEVWRCLDAGMRPCGECRGAGCAACNGLGFVDDGGE